MSDAISVLGGANIARFSGQRGRTAEGSGRSAMRYPSPFFDLAHTYLPPSMKALLRWCRYYYMVNPLINSVVHKMSEYPVTEIVVDETNQDIREKWETLLGQHLRYRPFQIECGLDYFTYGLCAVTVHFPFTKWLICRSCGKRSRAQDATYKWRGYEYVLFCKCGMVGPAKILDFYEKDVRRIRLVRWNPEYINVEQGFGGADPIYTFELPLQLKNDLIMGKRAVLDTVPDVFVEALRRNKFIRFTNDNLFIIRRPVISQKDNGWGMPLILPVLKDTFYLQTLRKAQEMIAQEHIMPLRILFPQAGSSTSDPYSTTNLPDWRSRIENEIAKWKYDNNYIPILPLPLGNETIGGDGKALGLYQEMQVWSDQIVQGMGVPLEFVKGGLSYTGSSVSMRILENSFIGYRTDHENMLNNFVIRRIANFMGWPIVKAHMKRFKMADDLQRMAFHFQLNQAQKISDQTLLAECDFEASVEEERKKLELGRQIEAMRKMQVAQANIQGEVMMVQANYQAEMQKKQMEQQQAMGGGAQGAGDGAQTGIGGLDQMLGQDGGQGGVGDQGQAGGMPGGMGGQPGGQEGEMQDLSQTMPGVPQGTSVSPENGQQAPQDGVPLEAQSPLMAGQQGGGQNLLYIARRVATQIKKLGDQDPTGSQKTLALNNLKMGQPQLYSVVVQILMREQGSQVDAQSASQSPLPQQKPERRDSRVGA